jgi:YcxB-like protein
VSVLGEIEITYPVFRRMVVSFLGVRVLLVRLFGLLVLGYAFWQAVAGTHISFVGPAVLCFVVFGVPELIVWITWRVRRDKVAGPNRFRVNASAVDVQRPSGGTRVEWADVTRVRRGRHAWSVTRTGFRALMIPRAAFSAEDQRRVNDFFLSHPEFAG